MSNKFRQYESMKPTEGNPSSRVFKRRKWKDSWSKKFLAEEGRMNYMRSIRRLAWRMSKSKFMNAE